MKLINGEKIANEILADLKKEIAREKLRPGLAIVLVGDDPASHLYVRLKEKAAQQIGVKIKKYLFSDKTSEKDILKTIDFLNQDTETNGILVQMPLPENLSADKIIRTINPQKDVDGLSVESQFDPPFILAIWQALQASGENLATKNILALVNSKIFGEKLVDFLNKRHLKVNYLIHPSAQNFEADIIITALGQPNFIKGEMIKDNAILIDGGISQKNGKIIGDIDQESVREKAGWLAPVPGGVGPITVAYLLKNVVLAVKRQR